jgi:UDP-2-acetamido-3-amino-2,3-dideoxy-glucuronate N-acetyltransferase
MIVAGAVIGEFSVVSAGAVVVNNVPPHALVAGNPAHIQGWVCQCGKLLKFHNHFARCSSCDVSYTKSNHRIKIATF